MGINKNQLADLIAGTLKEAGLYSPEAENLLLLTAAQESHGGVYIRQISGPALGIFQMEPATHDDIWQNYLGFREKLGNKILEVSGLDHGPDSAALEYNIKYAILMARIKYYRSPKSLPKSGDINGLAKYWKEIYNTPLGAGTVSEAVRNYQRYCGE